jgi:glycosyltransferase involved in cell wall biosynthesis
MGQAENWVVTALLGEPSEAWLYRQITGQRKLSPRVVCWDYRNPSVCPLNEIPVHVQPFDLLQSNGPGRWLRRLRNAPQGNFYATMGAERRALENLLLETRPSVILCHFGHTALRILPAATAHRVPLVAHFHGFDASSALRNRWYRWSLLRSLKKFAAVVVVGSHQRQWMLDHGVPSSKVHLIPCGVPTAEFSPAPRPVRNTIRFLTVSRLVENKGLSYSLRAFAAVCQRGVSAELVVVGEGPDRPALEKLTQELRLDGVTFRGALPPSQVKQEMQEADIFVQHSLVDSSGSCEGFGVSIAEAMSMELPIIATRLGGIPDQVIDDGTGILVSPKSVEAMAVAMYELAQDPQRRAALGKAGRQRVVEYFDTARQIAQLEDVMLQCASSCNLISELRDA